MKIVPEQVEAAWAADPSTVRVRDREREREIDDDRAIGHASVTAEPISTKIRPAVDIEPGERDGEARRGWTRQGPGTSIPMG
jgi:hypothetical protein